MKRLIFGIWLLLVWATAVGEVGVEAYQPLEEQALLTRQLEATAELELATDLDIVDEFEILDIEEIQEQEDLSRLKKILQTYGPVTTFYSKSKPLPLSPFYQYILPEDLSAFTITYGYSGRFDQDWIDQAEARTKDGTLVAQARIIGILLDDLGQFNFLVEETRFYHGELWGGRIIYQGRICFNPWGQVVFEKIIKGFKTKDIFTYWPVKIFAWQD